MRRAAAAAAAALLLLASGAAAQDTTAPGPVVFDFEAEPGLTFRPGGGWSFGPVRGEAPEGEAFVRLENAGPEAPPSMAAGAVPAEGWIGQTVRLSAWLRVDGDHSPLAGLWLRIDGAEEGPPLFFDNMSERPVAPGGWSRHEITAYVPPGSGRLVFGLLKSGVGSLDADALTLSVTEPVTTTMSPEARAYLDEALGALEAGHINRAAVDWAHVREVTDRMAARATTPAEVRPAIRVAIEMLGERHTFLRPPPRDPAAPGAAAAPAPMPRGETAAPGVGLLTVPARPSTGGHTLDQAYRDTLAAAIERLEADGTCGWIVDLRGNGGGNMWPMLNGLEPLLGAGPFGHFGNADGPQSRWVRRDGRIVNEPMDAGGEGETPVGRLAEAPVAVLFGPRTGSSGEMTAIAFLSRPRTRTFGAPSGGLTTANVSYRLPDGAQLVITTTGVHDGDGRFITGPLVPDEATSDDETLPRALEWLATQGCSAQTDPA